MNGTGGALDPFITLSDAQGVPLATDDDSGGECNARLAFVIRWPGVAQSRVEAGAYDHSHRKYV